MPETFSAKFSFSNACSSKDKVRIKFLSGTIAFSNSFHINPNFWTLKSWYKRHGKNTEKVEWLDAIHCNIGLNESKIKNIVESENPDIICFGLYIWNYDLYSRLGKYIKENWPNIIIIAGGPDVYAHKELNLFWESNTWLDVAVYGDGEEAFTTIIDNIIDSNTANQEANNISYICNNIPILESFKRFKNAEFNHVSPFIDNENDVKFAINQVKEINPNFNIILNWEFTKGCPYSCSFCDWSSGLHHKVTRKSYDWKLDLDFFASLGISIRWVDANVGMFKDDINVIKYAHDLEEKNPQFKLTFNNLAKLHKKAVFDIIDYIETVKPGNKIHNLAVQDISEDVLENINRPDVPWPEYKKYITDTNQKHLDFRYDIEIMLGMPGQNLERFGTNLLEYIDAKPRTVLAHIWCMLINSPGYNPEYRKQYGLKIAPALHITKIPEHLKTRDEIIANIDDCEYYAASTVVATNTASTSDIMAMYGMVMLYNNLKMLNKKIDLKLLYKVLLNFNYWKTFGNSISTILENDLQVRNKMLLLPELHGIPVTFNDYFGNKDNLLKIIKSAY